MEVELLDDEELMEPLYVVRLKKEDRVLSLLGVPPPPPPALVAFSNFVFSGIIMLVNIWSFCLLESLEEMVR